MPDTRDRSEAPDERPVAPAERPQYRLYRTRPRLLPGRSREGGSLLDDLRGRRPARGERRPTLPGRRKPITVWRVLRWVAGAIVAWLLISLAAFLVSSLLQGQQVSDATERALDPGGAGLFAPTTTLILGSDQRTQSTAEPGSSTEGPSRADTILLMRSGGGASSKLSIPRDTVVDIPGAGRNKINAAYAIGGAALTIATVKQFLGIEVNHVIEVDFERFPELVDAMGGITYRGGCVVSRINGGFRNGGYTLRLPAGESHIDGDQALALARTRTNLCNRSEGDLSRARRQQKILGAMRSRVFSPAGFVRLPVIAWAAPRTVKTDMGGPTLLAFAAGVAASGDAPTRVLRPSGSVTLPDGGSGLVVSEAERQAEVRRFLAD
jgi:LCP family protein required for cell wall assembly